MESVEIHSEDYDDPLIATFFLDSILPEVNTVLHCQATVFIAATLQECSSYFAVEEGAQML